MYVSKYIEAYWDAIASKMKELPNVTVVDKLFYYYRDFLEDHKSFRNTVADVVRKKERYLAIGVNRGELRANDYHRGMELGLKKDSKLGGAARIVDFDLSVTILTNSAIVAETFESYYVCELFRNKDLKIIVNTEVGPLTLSVEHEALTESSSVGFDENTAGLMKVVYLVRLSGIVVSPFALEAPYVDSLKIVFPE